MRKKTNIICALSAALLALTGGTAAAQTLNVQTGSVTYAFPAAQVGEMTYLTADSLVIMGRTFAISDIDLIYVDQSAVTDGTVTVAYDGTSAAVTVAGNVARYVTPAVSGAHVSLVQSDEVGDDTCGEITYALSGTSADGSFSLTGTYKASLELRGLTLTNPSGAALDIQDGKRISLSVKKDTENALVDGSGGSQKGCIVCKGHLELKGKGSLTVTGNTAHAVFAKEYVEMKNCTVTIPGAVTDGINCNQYFLLESGTLSISGVGDDGIQVSYKDDADRDAEDTGTLTIADGTLTIAVTAAAAKGLKAEGDVVVSGGTIDITTSGSGTWDTDDLKTKASACIAADGGVAISGGTLTLASTGSGGKGIGCDGALTISGGTTTATTSGGLYAYVNGREYTNYTGNTDNLSTNYKSSPKGMRAEGGVTITDGVVNVTTTGNGGEGIESKAEMTISGGTITVNSYDDGLNSSSHMYLKGGDITCVASNNDGIDSNGNMYISGGTIRAFGTSSPECGLDANEEDGYSVVFTGGTVLAVGGGNSVPSTSASTQAYVSGSSSVSAGQTVTLKSGSTTLATFTVPDNYTSSSFGGRSTSMQAPGGGGPGGGGNPGGGPGGNTGSGGLLITCAGLTSGSSYTLTVGTSSTSVTAALTGSSSGRP